jgi:2'-5' RNA ligase superfamily
MAACLETTQSVLIRVPEAELVVGGFRREGDWSFRHGVPAHITIAGPWPLSLAPPAHALSGITKDMRGTRFTLAAAGLLGDAVCLFPGDDQNLMHWRDRLLGVARSPDAVDEDWRLHLTVCRNDASPSAAAALATVQDALPIACVVEGLTLARRHGEDVTLRNLWGDDSPQPSPGRRA